MTNDDTSRGFRVAVEDLTTGETEVMLVAPGDYFLATFEPAYLLHVQRHPKAGSTVLTIKNHRPEWGARREEPGRAD